MSDDGSEVGRVVQSGGRVRSLHNKYIKKVGGRSEWTG